MEQAPTSSALPAKNDGQLHYVTKQMKVLMKVKSEL
jgi:hypothetical protein